MELFLGILDVAGKIWNLPNTMVGLIIGGVTRIFGGAVGLGHNAIEFRRNPLMDFFNPRGAITFGNVIIYGSDAYSTGRHEIIHTYQGEFWGPAYISLHIIGMTLSLASYPISSLHRRDAFHGRLNFMEESPFSSDLYGY
jgi:hypothetical protein